MFDSAPYDITFVQRSSPIAGDDFIFALIFKFFTNKGLKYIIRAECFEHEIYSIKYYVARDRKREDKYYRLTNDFNAVSIFITCASILPTILENHPTASFCFNATRLREDKKDRIEGQENNQRFRLYKKVVERFIGSGTFEHFSFEEVSSYLLVNRSGCTDVESKKNRIRELFLDIFDFYDSI